MAKRKKKRNPILEYLYNGDPNKMDEVLGANKETVEVQAEVVQKLSPQQSPQEKFHGHLTQFRRLYPDLPPLPEHLIHYEGWFRDAKKRMELRSQQRTAKEHIELLKQLNELHGEYLRLAQTNYDLSRVGARAVVEDLKITKEMRELELDIAKLERDKLAVEREAGVPKSPEQPKREDKMKEMEEMIHDETLIKMMREEDTAKRLAKREKLRKYFEQEFPDQPEVVERLMDELARTLAGKE